MKVEEYSQFIPGVNLARQDSFHMLSDISKNVTILHHTFSSEIARYIIIVDPITGLSIRIDFTEHMPAYKEYLEKKISEYEEQLEKEDSNYTDILKEMLEENKKAYDRVCLYLGKK